MSVLAFVHNTERDRGSSQYLDYDIDLSETDPYELHVVYLKRKIN